MDTRAGRQSPIPPSVSQTQPTPRTDGMAKWVECPLPVCYVVEFLHQFESNQWLENVHLSVPSLVLGITRIGNVVEGGRSIIEMSPDKAAVPFMCSRYQCGCVMLINQISAEAAPFMQLRLCHQCTANVTRYDIWDEKEKARAYMFTASRDL